MPQHSKGGDPFGNLDQQSFPSKPCDSVDTGELCKTLADSAGVQGVGSGEGCDDHDVGSSGSGFGEIGAGSTGVQGVGSGEGLSEGSDRTWCGLCEDWVSVEDGRDCKQCGCSFQQPPKEASYKNSQNQIKTGKSQNPNKKGKIPNINMISEEAELDLEGSAVLDEPGEQIEASLDWIGGSDALLGNVVSCVVDERGGGLRVIIMEPDGEGGDRLPHNTVEGLSEAESELQVPDRVVVDVCACVGSCVSDGEVDGLGGRSELEDEDGDVGVDEHQSLKACDLVHEVEELHAPVAEELRVIEVVGSRQRDIDDFAEWLDESQLRLAAFHEEALQDWIEGTEVHDAEALQVRDQLNKIWQHVEDIRYELGELCAVQISDDLAQLEEACAEPTVEAQVVLQTRIVSNWEVSQQWDLWKPAAVAELDELVVSKEALERSDLGRLRELELRGCKVIQLPSKLVCSLNAPAGRRKIRLVACGNYMALIEKDKRTHREVVYASATSVEALRTCVSWSVRRKHVLLTADIRAAFLNAQLLPRARMEAEKAAKQGDDADLNKVPEPVHGDEVIALVPPRLLVSKGLVDAKTRYIVKKALYGLDQAPRDWSLGRDHKLEQAEIPCEGVVYRFFRSFVEDNVWLIHHCEPLRGFEATLNDSPHVSDMCAWVIVYVDDILVGGPRNLATATMSTIQRLWQCSEPEEVGCEKAVRFLGLDLVWISDGLLALGQESYLRDLVERYSAEVGHLGHPIVPLASFFDEEVVEDSVEADQLRRTQGILGELLWASIRTRPDITFTISKLAGRTTKAPSHVYKAALHTLAYLSGTMSQVLTYSSGDRVIDSTDQRRSSLVGVVQGYGDASFAPEAKRSMQCLQVFTEGNLVAWSVSRQPFMTLSSCESEMVTLLDLGSYTQSMAFLMDELLQRKACKELLGDNVASLAIFSGVGSHWRTRHLRIRARAFNERNLEGNLPAFHIAGERNPADIGTKGLQGIRHWKLCQLLGLQSRELSMKKVQGGGSTGFSFRDCLLAVVLACCLRTADAQPEGREASGDRVLWAAVVLIVISAIAVWECLRGLFRVGERCCRGRWATTPLELPEPEPDREEPDEPQPDQEDELVEDVGVDPLVRPAEEAHALPQEEGEHHEHPHREELIPRPPQPPYPEGLRRRPMPVYAPEPDDEPGPRPPRNPPPEYFQGVVLGRYVDDVAIGIPQEVLGPDRAEAQFQGIAQPPEPRVRIREYEEIRQQVIQEQAERHALGLPVQPPVVLNPSWGPATVQPTLRQVRQDGNDWGGPGSVAFHPPPPHYRGDFFQIDFGRGVLIRWHGKSRTRLFTPETATLPEPLSQHVLTGRRRSFVTEMTRWYHIEDNFRHAAPTRAMPAQWRGRTELEIDLAALARRRNQAPQEAR